MAIKPNPIKPTMAVSKFEKGSSTYICMECGKRTRNTEKGSCHAAMELCARCYADNEAYNQEIDGASS